MRDGVIVVGIEKERLTRRKHDGFNDNLTAKYCLEAAGITWEDVALVVDTETFNPEDALEHHLRSGRQIPPSVRRVSISHHLAHAYSAAGPAGVDESIVVVVDGRGDGASACLDLPPEHPLTGATDLFETISIYHWARAQLTPLFKEFSPTRDASDNDLLRLASLQNSVGEYFAAVSRHVFGSYFSEGKLMGLAPFGNTSRHPPGLVFEDGKLKVFSPSRLIAQKEKDAGFARREGDFFYYADLAARAQQDVERVIIDIFRFAQTLQPTEYACYAGGVALNAVANAKVAQELGYRRLFVQPAAGDNGLAVGCCYYGWHKILERESSCAGPWSTFLGRVYSDSDIERALQPYIRDGAFRLFTSDRIARSAAELLATGHVIGWFQGGSEFGPRALGHRSILGDPRRPGMQDFINRAIKRREDFRPFAPAVISSSAETFFEGATSSPYMTFVAKVKQKWRTILPAVTHVDGSARLQTVAPEQNPAFHQLLTEFGLITGIPILLNTSFNGRSMPIVETPQEAIAMFASSPLHALAIGNRLVVKSSDIQAPAVPE
ncbi:MAG: transferase [Alphaproteobacteria bacterium]|nr:transferase [Alphaproteobacteria bacterium]